MQRENSFKGKSMNQKLYQMMNYSLYNKNLQNKDSNESTNPQEISMNCEEIFLSPIQKKLDWTEETKNNYNINNIYSSYVKKNINNSEKNELLNNLSNNYYGRNQNTFLSKKKYKKIYSPFCHEKKEEKLGDRFIPLNKGINLMEKFNLTSYSNENDQNKNSINISTNDLKNKRDLFNQILKDNILQEKQQSFFRNEFNDENNFETNNRLFIKEKIFSYKKKYRNSSKENYFNLNRINSKEDTKSIINNNISVKPYKELPVGKLLDDFYLNLLDWSSKNKIAVGCTYSVLIWNNNNSQSSKLFEYSNFDKYVSSLIWSEQGEKLAVGNSLGTVEIYDINKWQKIIDFDNHKERVGVVAWNDNIISSGSKDCTIINKDIRCKGTISKFLAHRQEICGLKWSFDGTQLASGSNDNLLMVWNLHSNKPIMWKNDHTAAVKALAWSPHKHNILATGGGTADKSIRMWNTSTNEQILKYDTGSQVCNLLFSKTSNELVSTHGYSLNQINIWALPNMKKIGTLIGHNYRVLYLSLSPDGQSIVTGAGEKTIKFWNVFPPKKEGSWNDLFPSTRDYR